MQAIIDFILQTVHGWGYLGIFALMAIESSFIPFPSEVVIIPAGYLAYQGHMSLPLIILFGVLGSLAGAFINYYLAFFLGRKFLYKYGKYFFVYEESLQKSEQFFRRHGAFSTFTGRLIPVIRQFISIPAGLSEMNIAQFVGYTGLGSAIWVLILALVGYFIGQNQELIQEYMRIIVVGMLVLVAIGTYIYIRFSKK